MEIDFVIHNIFSYCHVHEVGRVLSVSKSWNSVGTSDIMWRVFLKNPVYFDCESDNMHRKEKSRNNFVAVKICSLLTFHLIPITSQMEIEGKRERIFEQFQTSISQFDLIETIVDSMIALRLKETQHYDSVEYSAVSTVIAYVLCFVFPCLSFVHLLNVYIRKESGKWLKTHPTEYDPIDTVITSMMVISFLWSIFLMIICFPLAIVYSFITTTLILSIIIFFRNTLDSVKLSCCTITILGAIFCLFPHTICLFGDDESLCTFFADSFVSRVLKPAHETRMQRYQLGKFCKIAPENVKHTVSRFKPLLLVKNLRGHEMNLLQRIYREDRNARFPRRLRVLFLGLEYVRGVVEKSQKENNMLGLSLDELKVIRGHMRTWREGQDGQLFKNALEKLVYHYQTNFEEDVQPLS